jgi:hypothetical protein
MVYSDRGGREGCSTFHLVSLLWGWVKKLCTIYCLVAGEGVWTRLELNSLSNYRFFWYFCSWFSWRKVRGSILCSCRLHLINLWWDVLRLWYGLLVRFRGPERARLIVNCLIHVCIDLLLEWAAATVVALMLLHSSSVYYLSCLVQQMQKKYYCLCGLVLLANAFNIK